MSDFHDALRRAAQQHGEEVAPGLSADAVVTSSVHGISRGRQRRAAAQAGAGALGVVAIGVAGWVGLPLLGEGNMEPAGPEIGVEAGPWRYDAEPGEATEGDPQVMLQGEDEVMCLDELSLDPGVRVHDDQAYERSIWLEAALARIDEAAASPPPSQPNVAPTPEGRLTPIPSAPQWVVSTGGEAASLTLATLRVVHGTVTGLSLHYAGRDRGEGTRAEATLVPGGNACAIPTGDLTGTSAEPSGQGEETLVVAQFWATGDSGDGDPLATIVVDSSEPANTTDLPRIGETSPTPEPTAGTSGVPEPSDEPTPYPATPAHLRAPEGSEYQAFVVERPQPGCSPLADLLAAGQPSPSAPEYTVEVPGVTDSLTAELWARGTLATLPAGDDPWFLKHHAWLVSQEITDGVRPEAHLEWTGDRVLQWGESDPLQGPDCAYVEVMPQIGGSVFLVIDGVDPSVAGSLDSPDDYQTWVYLGEAD
ncbi:hypothetical protein ACNI3K_01120 [Demequina sp. SO4-13]|uniref:hypothetical protein n=1 Tax=Demequina sp. SO4-13 TaxID=3401027 RepID=UPI003AF506D6